MKALTRSMKTIQHIVILLMITHLYSCRNCEDTSEPRLLVKFNGGLNYTKVVGVGGSGNLTVEDRLPLAINADTTTYLFFTDSITDTVSITYNRNFRFEKEDCGFTITLDSFKLLRISTFDSAVFVIKESESTLLGESNKNVYEVSLFR